VALGDSLRRRLPLGDGWSAEVDSISCESGRDNEPAVDCALERVWPTGERGCGGFGGFEMRGRGSLPQIEAPDVDDVVGQRRVEVRRPARGDSLVPLGGVGHRPLSAY